MKTSRVVFTVLIVLASCGNRSQAPQAPQSPTTTDTVPTASAAPAITAAPAAPAPENPAAAAPSVNPAPASPAGDTAPSAAAAPFAAAAERAAYEAALTDLAVADESVVRRMEQWADALAAVGELEAAILRVEELASAPESPPSVSFALSVLYGRKGLATKQYAALEVTERKAAAAPTVVFNLAVLYGRKNLLAASDRAEDILVGTLAISGEPADAALILDDAAPIPLPTAPLAVKAGPHRLRVERDGYEPFQETVEIGVGPCPGRFPWYPSRLYSP